METVFGIVLNLGPTLSFSLSVLAPIFLVLLSQKIRTGLTQKRMKLEIIMSLIISISLVVFCILIFAIAGAGI